MTLSTNQVVRDKILSDAKREAEHSILQLKSPALDKVIAYLTIVGEQELYRCGSQDDDIKLRRSQGKVAAIAMAVDLLGYEPPAGFQQSRVSA